MICIECDQQIRDCHCPDITTRLEWLINNGNAFARHCAMVALAERQTMKGSIMSEAKPLTRGALFQSPLSFLCVIGVPVTDQPPPRVRWQNRTFEFVGVSVFEYDGKPFLKYIEVVETDVVMVDDKRFRSADLIDPKA